MKKRGAVLFSILFIILISSSFLVLADEEDEEKITKAYDCLVANVEGKCSTISTEAKAFVLMALGECASELLADAKTVATDQQCWPKTSCNIKTTAQAILALAVAGKDTEKAANWLLSQKATPPGMTWYLQIDGNDALSCDITYDSSTHHINIGTDKKIDSNAGQCLTRARDNYWLEIPKGDCQTKEYTITCGDKSFISNLLYKEDGSTTIFVSGDTSVGYDGVATTEEIKSSCFGQANNCDYEGGLWAALALTYTYYDSDLSEFEPYLVTMASKPENKKYLPEAFLYYLDYPEFKNDFLTSPQYKTVGSNKGYWIETTTGSRFFNTALASYALQGEEVDQKTKARTWLFGTQDSKGCWGAGSDKIKDTAFLLHSLWPEYGPTPPECTEETQAIDCNEGQVCVGNKCVEGECLTEDDCENDEICDNYKCIECKENTDCNTSIEKCVGGKCIPKEWECEGDEQCSGTKVCTINHKCVDCIYNDDCTGDNVCTIENKCVQCVYDTDCTQEGYGCNSTNNICYKLPDCDGPEDCNGTDLCLDGFCVAQGPECTAEGDECDEGYECVNETCVKIPECTVPTDCNGSRTCINGSCVLIDEGGDDDDEIYCEEDRGYFCRSSNACQNDGGSIIAEYFCNSPNRCCNIPEPEKTCDELGGVVCSSDKSCSGTRNNEASDLLYGEFCCVAGNCEDASSVVSDCEYYGGTCRSSCNSDESINTVDDCTDLSDLCCVGGSSSSSSSSGGPGGKPSYLWVWILLILIVLAVLGIVFRNKLTPIFMQIKSKFGGGKRPRRRPGFPPPGAPPLMGRRPMPGRRPPPRRIMPTGASRPQIRRPPGRPPAPAKPKGELDDVLKKLKEMGK